MQGPEHVEIVKYLVQKKQNKTNKQNQKISVIKGTHKPFSFFCGFTVLTYRVLCFAI